jgi:5-methyltetrahydrofolate--homocysteine methyltransferase
MMVIIGEKINTSIKSTQSAVENEDRTFIEELAKNQVEAGAAYIDVNCGTFAGQEAKKMEWLIQVIQGKVDTPLCIDSPNAKAIEAGLKINRNVKPIINSITAEKERWNAILPLALEYNTSLIALCMDDDGIPDEPQKRLKIANRIAEEMVRKGIKLDDIFFDPMVKPISTDNQSAVLTLETMRLIKKEIPEAHIICGLSNVSFGLPVRRLLNTSFFVSAIFAGLDAAIMNPLDNKLMAIIYATEALSGKDEYCMEYISKYREGSLET